VRAGRGCSFRAVSLFARGLSLLEISQPKPFLRVFHGSENLDLLLTVVEIAIGFVHSRERIRHRMRRDEGAPGAGAESRMGRHLLKFVESRGYTRDIPEIV